MYRNISKPSNLPDNLYIYDYKTIKKYQQISGLKEFSSILYIALLAEIVFLFFSSHYSEKCFFLENMQIQLGFSSINFFKKVFYLPIVLTVAFIIWRAKNYLLFELPLDIDTRFDKLLDVSTPIIFSFFVYFALNPCNIYYWLFACAVFFLLTTILTLKRYLTLRKENKYRMKIPYREKYNVEFNVHGYRAQVGRWCLLLLFETIAIVFIGIAIWLSDWLILSNSEHHISKSINSLVYNGNLIIIVVLNYLVGAIICLFIYYMTTLSKSVRPVSIEAYEKEMMSEINQMSFNPSNSSFLFQKKWFLLKIQYRALKYLRRSDIKNKQLFVWRKEMDKYIN
jgi:hypothetical protein